MNQIMDLASLDWVDILYIFVGAAEHYITGTKRGAERKEWVAKQFYALLPKIVTQFVTEDQLSEYIEQAVICMKEYLANKKS